MEGNTSFKGVKWASRIHRHEPILVGAGGIGSHLAFQLALAGFNFSIYDGDTVEDRNTSQLFTKEQIGDSKVGAVQEVCRTFNSDIDISKKPFNMDTLPYDVSILFLGVDNNESRRNLITQAVKKGVNYIIDGRLNVESFAVFVISDDVLYNDKEISQKEALEIYLKEHCPEDIEEPICSLKQTPHFASMVASKMVETFTKFLYKEEGLPQKIPFHYSYGIWD